MSPQEEIISKLRRVLPELHTRYGVLKIGLFGSFARGNPKPESDIDLVVELERPLGLEFMDLSDHLQKLFNRHIDVLTPAGIDDIREKEIAEEIRHSMLYV